MLGKRSRSVIARLSELLPPRSRSPSLDFFSGDQSGNDRLVARADTTEKPNNCCRIFELDHGVGLAIIVALEKPSASSGVVGGGGTGFCSKYFVCSPRSHGRSDQDWGKEEEEDYTYVTFHGPKESFTMVYYDRCESDTSEGGDRVCCRGRGEFSGLGFLSCCQLCGRKLHGQDIFTYRAEKGFCSVECQSGQTMIEERSEQGRFEAPSAAADAWSYSEAQIFLTSILAA